MVCRIFPEANRSHILTRFLRFGSRAISARNPAFRRVFAVLTAVFSQLCGLSVLAAWLRSVFARGSAPVVQVTAGRCIGLEPLCVPGSELVRRGVPQSTAG